MTRLRQARLHAREPLQPAARDEVTSAPRSERGLAGDADADALAERRAVASLSPIKGVECA